jgi:hypothetical protein
MRKGRKKANGNPSRSANDRQLVEALTAKGLSGDVISELLNVNKNRLRREHAVALHIGRMKAKKQKAATKARDMTRAEMHAANAILVAFADEEWVDPVDGNLLWVGLDGDAGAKTPADAYARWLRDGGKFITSGISKNFGPERIAEFCKLKGEAEKLLRNERQHLSDTGGHGV